MRLIHPGAATMIAHAANGGVDSECFRELIARRERSAQSAAALAMAGRDRERIAANGLLSAVQSDMALLDCTHAAARRDFVLRRKFEASLVARSPSRIRLRPRLFLDGAVVGHHRDRARLVLVAVLYGALFRALCVVLWIAPATTAPTCRCDELVTQFSA